MHFKPTLYDFEGELRTANDIHRMMPIYSLNTIRRYLSEDPAPRTKQDIHVAAARHAERSKAQARKNAQAIKHTNHHLFIKKGKPE